MTVKELRALVATLPEDRGLDDMEVKVWLPGSRISLERTAMISSTGILIEGNVDDGSALLKD